MRSPAGALPAQAGALASVGDAGWRWLLLAVAAGFAALLLVPAHGWAGQLAVRLLFAGLPLAALAAVAGRRAAGALFGPFGLREAGFMGLAGLLSVVAALAMALLVQQFAPVAANPLAGHIAALPAPRFALELLSMLPQLLGEELLTVLPLLALHRWARRRLQAAPRLATAIAVLGSTLVFSAAHLPTYHWNWLQCFGVIGASRLVLTWAYLRTGSLWVCTGAHVLTDWTELTLAWLAPPGA